MAEGLQAARCRAEFRFSPLQAGLAAGCRMAHRMAGWGGIDR